MVNSVDVLCSRPKEEDRLRSRIALEFYLRSQDKDKMLFWILANVGSVLPLKKKNLLDSSFDLTGHSIILRCQLFASFADQHNTLYRLNILKCYAIVHIASFG